MALGIRNFFTKAANQVITNNDVLASAGLTIPVAANETVHVRYWIPFNTGATGGIRFQVVVPAGGSLFRLSSAIFNLVAPATVRNYQNASAVINDALANAGDHWVEVEATIVNGATAGNIDLQIAQDTPDAASLTVYSGATADVVKL